MPAVMTIDQLFALDQQCFPDYWSKSQWQTYLSQDDRFPCYTLFDANEPIGFALYQRLFDEAELLRIGVVPDRRGEGWAAKMLTDQLEQFTGDGISRVMLEVRASNEAAIRLYQSVGFVTDGLRKHYYPLIGQEGRQDAILMSRPV